MKKSMICAVSAILAGWASAEDIIVQDTADALLRGELNTITAQSVIMDAIPAEIGTPVFWFDASRTNGWEIAADGTVVRVPSLVGERYLTSDVTEEGTSWYTWKAGNAAQTMKPPFFVSGIAALGGGSAIDFGAQASGRGLLFNAVETADGSVKSHLENVGSVIAVYDSTDGGGFFLSGGKRNGMDWGRSFNHILAAENKGVTDFCNILMNHIMGSSDAKGMYWQDGLFGAVVNGGLGGQWQVVAYSPRTTLPFAVGLGIGCTAEWYKSYSGGMKIAEMLIFDKVLANEDLRKVSICLQKKWFGTAPAGYNGRSCVSSVRAYRNSAGAKSASVNLTVKAGERLEIGRFTGGRAGTKPANLRKSGEGTLHLRDIRNYNGEVTLAGGTLELAVKRKVPASAAELPRGLQARFDPSVVESVKTVESGGVEFVSALGSVDSLTYHGERIWAKAEESAETKPELLRDALGEGLHTVDFGAACNGGRFLTFATNEAQYLDINLPAICTLVAVVGAQQAGGHVLNGSMFRRGYQYVRQNDCSHTYALLNPTAQWSGDSPEKLSPQIYGTVYIDGEKRKNDAGYPTPTYHVVALQVPQGFVKGIGRYDATAWAGGFKLGEMLLFNRPLSDAELLDTQAYLSKKWFGRIPAGYEDATTLPDVQNLTVTEPSVIDVPEGAAVRIGRLTARARLEKTGAGTLLVGAGSDTSGVIVRQGVLKAEENPPDVAGKSELAGGDSLHLDAGFAHCFDLMLGHESEKRITCWNDVNFRNCAYQFALTQNEKVLKHPTLTEGAGPGGKTVVDFGDYVTSTDAGYSGYLTLEKPLDSVRSVYMVIGSAKGGGNPLGTFYKDGSPESYWGLGDFARAEQKTVTMETPWFSKANSNVKGGEIFIDGVKMPFDEAKPNGAYQLVELHTAAGASFSEIGRNISYYDMGGFSLGELVVYERELSEREKIATRNHLLKKWFSKSDGELQDLPEKNQVASVIERELTVDGEMELALDSPRGFKHLKGGGSLTKTQSGELICEDLSEFEGTVVVAEGDLKLTGRPLPVEPKLLAEGRLMHLDATQGISVETNADFSVSVNGWRSLLDDGWEAVPGVSAGDGLVHKPTFMPFELNDLPVVSMRYHGWNSGEEYMLFEKDGERKQLQGICGVFWVIGSQEGGGMLLGGGSKQTDKGKTVHRVWTRGATTGVSAGSSADHGLIDANMALDDVYAWSDWYRNGEKLASPRTTGLTGGYDTLSMALWPADGPDGHKSWSKASADGLAFHGSELDGLDWRQCRGNQRLGELIIYGRYLTEAEQIATEAYLSSKWGLSQKCHTNSAAVVLAEGARLVCENGSQFVGSVSGPGTVEGSVTVRRFVADGASGGFTVSGTLTVAPSPVFEVRNAVCEKYPEDIAVCSADAFADAENLQEAVLSGVPDCCRAKVMIAGGTLYVRLRARGTVMIVR